MIKHLGLERFVRTGVLDSSMLSRKPRVIGRYEFVWWGKSQFHKWRWNLTHIDMGPLSVYNIPEDSKFWKLVADIIKPLRWWYHKNYCKV